MISKKANTNVCIYILYVCNIVSMFKKKRENLGENLEEGGEVMPSSAWSSDCLPLPHPIILCWMGQE